MVIDAHAHACGEYLTIPGITDYLDQNNVDGVVLVPGELNSTKTYPFPDFSKVFPKRNVVQWTNLVIKFIINVSGKAAEIQEGNQYVHDLTRQCPEKIFQFFWVSQHIKDLWSELEIKYEMWEFKGLKLHQCWENFSVDSDYFRMTAGFAIKYDLPLFIHPYNRREVERLIGYHRMQPDLKLIIGHLFGIELFIEKSLKPENIYFEISTPQLVSEYRLKKALNHMGPERLILGSDTPYGRNNLAINIRRIKSLNLSQDEKDAILGNNMRSLLKI